MTRRDWEKRVLDYIRQRGGMSIFWVTNNRFLAGAYERLEKRGRIERLRDHSADKFPWMVFRIVKQRKGAK